MLRPTYDLAVTLNNTGVYIVEEVVEDPRIGPGKSKFLAAGSMQWKEGPVLPQDLESQLSSLIPAFWLSKTKPSSKSTLGKMFISH